MAGTEKILSAIRLANEAGVGERPWEDFLNSLNNLIGGVFSNLEIVDLSSGRYVELKSTEHIGINENYLEHYQSKNPRIAKLLTTRQSEIVHDHLAFSETDIDRDEFYNDFLAPHGLRYFAGIAAHHTPELLAGFSVQRSMAHGNIGIEQVAILKKLLPHMKTSLQTYMKLGELRRQTEAFQAMCHASEQPTVAVGRDCKVCFSNTAGSRILRKYPAMLRNGRLYLGDQINQLAMEARLAMLARDGPDAEIGDDRFILTGLARSATPVNATLSPIRNPETQGYPNDAVAVFVFGIPARADTLPSDALQRTYELSCAELELIEALSTGASLREAAVHRQVRYDTVRKQLRSVMSKMGVRRQSDLQSLLTWVKS